MIEKLEDLAKRYAKHAWVGPFPPGNFDIIDFNLSTNYRLSSLYHGQYDVVWFMDGFLEANVAWPLIFDEANRLLKSQGFLVIKYQDAGFLKDFQEYLEKAKHISAALIRQFNFQNSRDGFLLFKIDRKNNAIYHDKNWSIYIDLDSQEDINKVTDAFVSMSFNGKIEFLFKSKETLMTYEQIATKATYSNLLIIDDVYVPDRQFFSEFDQYGYDYDYLAFDIRDAKNKLQPVFCGVPSAEALQEICKPFTLLERCLPLQWIGFGPIAIKTHWLQCIDKPEALMSRFSLGLMMSNKAIPPRFHFLSAFKTEKIPQPFILDAQIISETNLAKINWCLYKPPTKPALWIRVGYALAKRLPDPLYLATKRAYSYLLARGLG